MFNFYLGDIYTVPTCSKLNFPTGKMTVQVQLLLLLTTKKAIVEAGCYG